MKKENEMKQKLIFSMGETNYGPKLSAKDINCYKKIVCSETRIIPISDIELNSLIIAF